MVNRNDIVSGSPSLECQLLMPLALRRHYMKVNIVFVYERVLMWRKKTCSDETQAC